jgi:hypothetical protein
MRILYWPLRSPISASKRFPGNAARSLSDVAALQTVKLQARGTFKSRECLNPLPDGEVPGPREPFVPADVPSHYVSNRIPSGDARAARRVSKSYYRLEAIKSAPMSRVLVATIAFIVGSGLALLILFGFLDFMKAGVHRGLNLIDAHQHHHTCRDLPRPQNYHRLLVQSGANVKPLQTSAVGGGKQ